MTTDLKMDGWFIALPNFLLRWLGRARARAHSSDPHSETVPSEDLAVSACARLMYEGQPFAYEPASSPYNGFADEPWQVA
jgi:hypothetical protein